MVNVISHLHRLTQRFKRDEAAATTIEYGVAAVIVVALVSMGADKIGNKVGTVFTSVEQKVAGETTEAQPAQAAVADRSNKTTADAPSKTWQLRP